MLKWNADELKKKIIAELAENGEIVGKFVETDARQRLLAITDPAWGYAYRSKFVARLLSYEVLINSNEVVINVGVRPSSTSRRHGFYIEIGSKKWPAHPYLRPAVFMNSKKIVDLLAGK